VIWPEKATKLHFHISIVRANKRQVNDYLWGVEGLLKVVSDNMVFICPTEIWNRRRNPVGLFRLQFVLTTWHEPPSFGTEKRKMPVGTIKIATLRKPWWGVWFKILEKRE
jgi:hypothetical protein